MVGARGRRGRRRRGRLRGGGFVLNEWARGHAVMISSSSLLSARDLTLVKSFF
jgi:hypothetical protein